MQTVSDSPKVRNGQTRNDKAQALLLVVGHTEVGRVHVCGPYHLLEGSSDLLPEATGVGEDPCNVE